MCGDSKMPLSRYYLETLFSLQFPIGFLRDKHPCFADYGQMSDEDDFRLKAKARKSSSRGAEVHIPANYKGFHQGVRATLVRGQAVSGRRTLMNPAKPRTGRFNARGRGRAALERGIGPKQG